jgi:hypothetical protein
MEADDSEHGATKWKKFVSFDDEEDDFDCFGFTASTHAATRSFANL